jgi:hypothetical protein
MVPAASLLADADLAVAGRPLTFSVRDGNIAPMTIDLNASYACDTAYVARDRNETIEVPE